MCLSGRRRTIGRAGISPLWNGAAKHASTDKMPDRVRFGQKQGAQKNRGQPTSLPLRESGLWFNRIVVLAKDYETLAPAIATSFCCDCPTQSSSRTMFNSFGASIPNFTALGPIRTMVTVTLSPMRILSPGFLESTSMVHLFLVLGRLTPFDDPLVPWYRSIKRKIPQVLSNRIRRQNDTNRLSGCPVLLLATSTKLNIDQSWPASVGAGSPEFGPKGEFGRGLRGSAARVAAC